MRQAYHTYHHGPLRVKVLILFCLVIAQVMLICVLPLAAWAYVSDAQGTPVPGQRISGHVVPLLGSQQPIGPTPANQPLQLSISLKLRNEDALNRMLSAQNDPTSSLYHHYLTPQEFNAQFAPTQASVDTVVAYARQQGFQVTDVSSNHLLVDVAGTVATADRAFATQIKNYRLQSRVVYAPSVDPYFPEAVEANVQAIAGLNNVSTYRPINLQRRLERQYPARGPGGGYTPDELSTAYDVKPLLASGNDGSGQTIALFEMDGYKLSDIAAYRQQYKLGPLKVADVLVDGATNTPGADALEVTLDMEVASALAPGAAQQVYIGPNTTVGINDTYNRIVTDNLARIVSVSWGLCEAASTPARMDGLDTIFKQGAVQGQTFFAASGDNGAYDCIPDNADALTVDSPASDPYVVGVGGTTLRTKANGEFVSESAWGNLSAGHAAGGGGGRSSHFTIPGYQSGSNLSGDDRQIPDVSANADPTTGYAIYYTSGSTNAPGWIVAGGTSAAAPLWAGIAADINQSLVVAHVAPPGHFSETLYQLYTTPQIYVPYQDIITGTNLYYKAVPGYDMATGLGTPDAWNIARDLQNAPALAAQVLQNAGFETGSLAWQQSSKGGYQLISTVNPHSGKYSTYFCSYPNCHDTLTQKVTLPQFSRRLTLSYWAYIGRGTTSTTTCQNTFQVLLQTEQGQPITTVQKLCSKDANGWVQYSFDVTDALTKYVGQTIQLVFEVNGSSEPRSNFFVNLDEVDFRVLTIAPGITTQMMQNISFENGSDPWQETSKGGYQLISTSLAHTGMHSAYLCGYPQCSDSIAQTVTLPTSTRNAVLSYWTYIGRSATSGNCDDTFHAYLRVPAAQGNSTITLHSLCSNDANGWVPFSFDITSQLKSYLGKPVQIGFNASGSSDPRANFFIDLDDILLYVTHA